MAARKRSKVPDDSMTLAAFVARYMPERGGLLRAGEKLGSDRIAAVFTTWHQRGWIEVTGFYDGAGDRKPLPTESYCVDRYPENRLICPDWHWWAEVEARFLAPPEARNGGRKEGPEWGLIGEQAFAWLDDNGVPLEGDGQQALFEEFITSLMTKMQISRGEATVRRHARKFIAAYQIELGKAHNAQN
jgi:hypothetical protein